MKKGLGSIPKSLSWINSEPEIVTAKPKKEAVAKPKQEKKIIQEIAAQIKPSTVDTTAQMSGRISPQLSCTISPEDKELLNELALYACNREKKMLNTSIIVRALIRLGNKYKEELTF